MGEDDWKGELTYEMLVRAFKRTERPASNFYLEHGYERYSALMRPYLYKPLPVMYAAYQLAANAACGTPLSPEDAEEAKAVLRQAGMKWEE